MLEANRIYCRDALQGLKQLPDNSIDLVVTDPPYNIASNNRSTMIKGVPMSTMKVWGQWDCFHPFDYDVFIMQVISECYRVLKEGGALYMFTSREHNGYFIRQAVARGFTYRNQLVMVKKNPVPSLSKKNWRSAFDLCFYVSKGKPKTFNFVTQKECKNFYLYANTHRQTRHPTEKPLDFIKLLVAVGSSKGELVLDPFMGSGTTAVACQQLDRKFIGFENCREYITMARKRLKGGLQTSKRKAA